MKAIIKNITPGIAKKMLEKNGRNRSLNKKHIKALACEMIAGRWKLNGEAIRLNEERLIDGQHRLWAVIESGVTIETFVIDGLPSDVFDTIDVGKRRSPGDTLSVLGEANSRNLAATLAVIDRYMTGRVNRAVRYSSTEVEELLEKYPGARRSVNLGMNVRKLIAPATLSGCHYLFAEKDEHEADEFVKSLRTGIGLGAGDPVYILRERLMQNSIAKAKLSQPYVMAIIIKAWNHRRAGKKVRCLRFREEGDCPESFPIVE